MIDNNTYLIALHSVNGLGPVRLKLLLDYYKDPKTTWEADPKELLEIGLPSSVVLRFTEIRKKLDPEKYLESIIKSAISYVTIFDENYPKLLKEIYDPPVVLFYKGNLKKADGKNIAMVGTRKITGYGKIVTEKFASELAQMGLTIVSGLAQGVDTYAHQSAISVGGQTIAVLGGGLNTPIFPPENNNLANKIINEGLGAIVSEFNPEEPSLKGNFPARNRIISGLSLAVLVTEAAEDSGSLITAKCALEQGREVFAIPGPITSEYSKGPSILIKQGARLITTPLEILEELGINQNINFKNKEKSYEGLTETDLKILECLKNENKHIDEICRDLSLSASLASASLIKMELKGLVKNTGSGNFTKIC